ncbi:MAG: FAD:protein FMN transferase [Bacillota bacterium]|nr:FAD:protein FMN transferase [Bacillota bacterium]
MGEWHGRAMATEIEIRTVEPPGAPAGVERLDEAARRALARFAEVERVCTRFQPDSPLMRFNRGGDGWQEVDPLLYRVVALAARARRRTGGRFDPRVLEALVRIGYDRTLPVGRGTLRLPAPQGRARPLRDSGWLQRRPRRRALRLRGAPLDLGGIGKGYAVRLAAREMAPVSGNFLVNAGGDLVCRGPGPEGDGWRVGVEDPRGGAAPVAVLAVRDRAVCTSSVRRRRWLAGDRPVHHLIDPRTGEPAASGLLAVTVVGADPAWCEVWSKALFVEGATGVRELAERERLAALWVTEEEELGWSSRMAPFLIWRAAA